MNFYYNNKYLISLVCLLAGLLFIYMEVISPVIKSKDDLLYVKDKLASYSFKYGFSGKSQTKEFYLHTYRYPCTYQIKADFIPYFLKGEFERSVFPGDSITIAVPKEQISLLSSAGEITAFEISSQGHTYLTHELTISDENNGLRIYAGVLFYIVSDCFVYPDTKRNNTFVIIQRIKRLSFITPH